MKNFEIEPKRLNLYGLVSFREDLRRSEHFKAPFFAGC